MTFAVLKPMTAALLVSASLTAEIAAAVPFTYGGRMTEANGKPIDGPIDLQVNFYHRESGGAPRGPSPITVQSVKLVQGVFQLSLDLSVAELHEIFTDFDQAVWIEIND